MAAIEEGRSKKKKKFLCGRVKPSIDPPLPGRRENFPHFLIGPIEAVGVDLFFFFYFSSLLFSTATIRATRSDSIADAKNARFFPPTLDS